MVSSGTKQDPIFAGIISKINSIDDKFAKVVIKYNATTHVTKKAKLKDQLDDLQFQKNMYEKAKAEYGTTTGIIAKGVVEHQTLPFKYGIVFLSATGLALGIAALLGGGKVGPTGPAGLEGVAGVNGVNGVNGANGVNGDNGSNGAQGAAGNNGLDGAVGSQGPAGVVDYKTLQEIVNQAVAASRTPTATTPPSPTSTPSAQLLAGYSTYSVSKGVIITAFNRDPDGLALVLDGVSPGTIRTLTDGITTASNPELVSLAVTRSGVAIIEEVGSGIRYTVNFSKINPTIVTKYFDKKLTPQEKAQVTGTN